MDWTLVAIMVGGGLTLILIVAVILNRAWGNFPGPASGLPPTMPPSTPTFVPPATPSPPDLPAGAPIGGMVPITHPLIRQALLKGMERGGSPYISYFIKDGEQIYLLPDRIADLKQREDITRLFTAVQHGDAHFSFSEIIRVVQELTNKRS
ncbi:MAG: hypothetical protein HGA65_19725 [Oscillochloris sp.]|nr:hypothetical protein [Oscillochloris sp.]